MRKKSIIPGLAGCALALSILPALAADVDDYQKCLLKVSANDLEAKVEFQTDLAGLVIEANPELGNLASLNRDLQIGLAKARNMKLNYLIEDDVARLVSASGLTRFAKFDWSARDDADLGALKPEFSALLDQLDILAEENSDNPAWPDLRARFVELQEGKEFQKILERFIDQQEKAGQRLEKC